MAKGKALNPADAVRKAARKKELKKNKELRQKTRDFALVKKDTTDLEEEISTLEGLSVPSKDDKTRLAELKSELAHIQKKKEDYVAEHPEQRNLVYRRKYDRPKDGGEGGSSGGPDATASVSRQKAQRNLFKKNGLPRHPERSIYFDPIMNPYGMPPPGMPYQERALLPNEVDSEAEEGVHAGHISDSDDEIAMPEGAPPSMQHDSDSDSDIPLPEGAPPNANPLPVNGQLPITSLPPLPPGPAPSIIAPDTPASFSIPQLIPGMPAFPPNHFSAAPSFMPHAYPSHVPPPPPGFFPQTQPTFGARRMIATGAAQDPLSRVPHQAFQGYRAPPIHPQSSSQPSTSTLPPPPSSLPAKPKPPPSTNATISAEPQLRDFKKESTMFVPSTLKRRKGGASKVDAAPSAGETETGTSPNFGDGDVRPDLMGTLREKLGPMASAPSTISRDGDVPKVKRQTLERPKDDYDRFMDEIGGLLAPS